MADLPLDSGTLARRGAAAAAVAVVVNAVVVLVVPPAIDHPPFDPLTLGSVTLFTLLGVVGATAVLALLQRTVERPGRTFVVVSAVVLLLSFVPDLTVARSMPGATTAGVVLLMAMHVVVAVVAVGVLLRGLDGLA